MRKILLSFFLTGLNSICLSQVFNEWEWDQAPVKYNSIIIPSDLKHNGIVIINEKAEFDFRDYSTKELQKTVLLKILNEEGLHSLSAISLPESFDIAENVELRQQGRLSKIKIPFIESYNIRYFIGRIIRKNGTVIDAHPKYHVDKVRWIKPNGEYADDYVNTYSFNNLEVGDIIEYAYKVVYKPNYGSDILYLSSRWPKMNLEYNFKYFALPTNKNYKFLFTSNIPDSCVKYHNEGNKDGLVSVQGNIKLKNVQRINYFIHASASQQLPFVYFNMNYSIKLFNSKKYSIANVPDFKWTNIQKASNYDSRFNIKRVTDIKKFVAELPGFKNDTNNLKFIKTLNDTLNNFKYYSSNYMLYNDPRLYSLYSTDHLFKRRIVEFNMLEIYENILNEKGIFYYVAKIQDKRLGELNPLVRISPAYENIVIAVPVKNSYLYLIPRYQGLKYFLNELPFYYQNTVAALFPSNYQAKGKSSFSAQFKFVKTYQGTDNDNVRTENDVIKINVDSLNCSLEIKENLVGQFSTILRPYYLNELIDSTIPANYFKRCTEKPNSSGRIINLKSKSEEYPFRFSFNGQEKVILKEKGAIDLTNWFSFVIDKSVISEEPTHDFYFDFPFSDSYNFMIEFDKPATITNMEEINKSIDNEYFELSSILKKQENAYLLSVMVKIKKRMLPTSENKKLVEFIQQLDELNKFKIVYTL